MNYRLIARLLGGIVLLLGASMALSLVWAFPAFGQVDTVEWNGLQGLLGAMAVCAGVGGGLMWWGRSAAGQRLFRKEALAVVGLSWLLATLLGAIPYWLSGTCRQRDSHGQPVRMDLFDGLFESASGFSGTGASVLCDVEDPQLVPRSVLFWRSQTHFLGGLGIVVLFVAILGMGSVGKALLTAEAASTTQQSIHERAQHAAWAFAFIFIGLNALLTVLLMVQGVSLYHALCHAFGTVATGGFSTFNNSIGHFQNATIEMTIALFMFLGCTNFTLLYFFLIGQGKKILQNTEFRVYVGILGAATLAVAVYSWKAGPYTNLLESLRYSLFQVVSIMTNTGFGTADFDQWSGFAKGVLLFLMYVGGCMGSTSCSVKVVRYVLLAKSLWLQLEHVFRPNVVRQIRLNGEPVDSEEVHKVPLYFCLIVALSLAAWLILLAVEPDATWTESGHNPREKLADCASAVAATINGVGPGIGLVGVMTNYAALQAPSKLVLTLLMLLGRLEVFPLILLLLPRFWKPS
ncbi:MAG: TrkH family potassium uptake protein [Thermoguttaceae bacterium]|nr:TrkH family potassium uptake protein [Thermoguttaceae bacterium]MDW8037320.1 TrkH family potassium uptake protein [Thermoguttaceae bacterium]